MSIRQRRNGNDICLKIACIRNDVFDVLQEHNIDKEAETLQRFYDSVKMKASDINSASAKQKIVVELYDKFFRNAFPKMTERLGIVYTPVEVVDFIIHSVNDVLKNDFGQTLGSENVHIIDPFTGTGTFITRLLQSGLISKEQLPHKYKNEIHANELVLLAYYIAAINIESVYHDLMSENGEVEYEPFEGICLTDTFQLHEKDDLVSELLIDNSARRVKQKALDIRVIVGNPPYSVGQKKETDGTQKIEYKNLDSNIKNTYAKKSKATLQSDLYNSYVRAIRWASDRLGGDGVIGFVTANGFIEKASMDGMRKCLQEEFANIYILNLRGDIRKNMLTKGAAKEGQNVFGSGSMSGISITIFVKNSNSNEHGAIYYHDIGDDLLAIEKLNLIADYSSILSVTERGAWKKIEPDQHGDWLKQRDNRFNLFIPLGDKKNGESKLFENFSLGIVTNRDSWCYNSSKKIVLSNMKKMIDFYNDQSHKFIEKYNSLSKKDRETKVNEFIDIDPSKISWTRSLKNELVKGNTFDFSENCIFTSLYRPFNNQWIYFNRRFNEMVYQMPRLFPNSDSENLVIATTAVGSRNGFSCLISKSLVDLNAMDGGAQCFPLYLYGDESLPDEQPNLFSEDKDNKQVDRRYALTDFGLAHFQRAYNVETISKEDIFYYIYGLLHSQDYRNKFADNLTKEIPRIPTVKKVTDFWLFANSGKKLAELHLNFDTVEPYPVHIDTRERSLTNSDYAVKKMKYGKNHLGKDLSRIEYNEKISISGIPLEAYEYVINGKPALDWVIDRQRIKEDTTSGIVNDANDWAIESIGNPKYPLELFQRVITVSLETMKIVNALPKLDT